MTWDIKDGVNYTGMTPEGKTILKKRGKWKNKPSPKIVKESPTDDLKDKLSGKKMKELQDFGRKYGALDTKKSELVDEIISKAPDDDINKFLESE